MAQFFELGRGGFQGGTDLGMQLGPEDGVGELGGERDPQRAWSPADVVRHLYRRRLVQVAGALPDAASSTIAASVTVRASTPLTVMPLNASGSGQVEILPRCGLIPTRWVHAAGMRTLPAPSDPIAAATRPAATAAALPPDDPPGVWSRDHGLRVWPKAGPLVNGHCPNSQVLVLPTITAPAAFSRRTTSASAWAGRTVAVCAESGGYALDVHVVLDRDRDA